MTQPRKALASGFNGEGDGTHIEGPAKWLFESLLSEKVDGKGLRGLLHVDPHAKISSDTKYSGEMNFGVKIDAHVLMLRHQQVLAERAGGWTVAALEDIKNAAGVDRGQIDNAEQLAFLLAFQIFSGTMNVKSWLNAMPKIEHVVVPMSGNTLKL
jgi:hypothetical protein